MPQGTLEYVSLEQFEEFLQALAKYAKWLIKGSRNGYLSMEYIDSKMLEKIINNGALNKGVFESESSLFATYPNGSTTIEEGSFTYVIGPDGLAIIYFWDHINRKWVTIAESSTTFTQQEILSALESNTNFNSFTTSYLNYINTLANMNIQIQVNVPSPYPFISQLSVGDSDSSNRYYNAPNKNVFLSVNMNWNAFTGITVNNKSIINNSVFNGQISLPMANNYPYIKTSSTQAEQITSIMFINNNDVDNAKLVSANIPYTLLLIPQT